MAQYIHIIGSEKYVFATLEAYENWLEQKGLEAQEQPEGYGEEE